MKLLIGADIVPTKEQYIYFANGNVEEVVDTKWFDLLESCDYSIFNLETPITDSLFPIRKQGENFSIPEKTIRGIKRLNPCFFTLANNHIMDQGVKGLKKTTQILTENGLSWGGVGNNLAEASRPFIFETDDAKIGIYCCAEYEYSIAGRNKPGANPFDPLYSLDHIAELKTKCDYVIVLYHGGKEYYRYPSPRLQENCRRIIEKGADLVICQHSHCIGCNEQWKNGTIIYGQGNACFTRLSDEFWDTALLIKVEIQGKCGKIDYVPLITKNKKVYFANEEEKENILTDFEKRSKEIQVEDFVEQSYREFANNNWEYYLLNLHGNHMRSVPFKIMNRLTGRKLRRKKLKQYYRKDDLIKIQNFVRNQAHRELLLKGLDNQL